MAIERVRPTYSKGMGLTVSGLALAGFVTIIFPWGEEFAAASTAVEAEMIDTPKPFHIKPQGYHSTTIGEPMLIPCTQAQFEAALAALKTISGVTVTLNADGQSGTVTTPQVDFGFGFNGTNLMTNITAKHGVAKFVSDSVVYSHIQDELLKVKA